MNVTVLINICDTGITRSGFYTTRYKSFLEMTLSWSRHVTVLLMSLLFKDRFQPKHKSGKQFTGGKC